MTAEPSIHSQEPIDVRGHHTADGRNIVPDDRGLGGKDIFFAAVQMTRMPMCMSDPHQSDMPLVFVNEAFQRMTGYEASEVLGRNCRFLQGPDTDPETVATIREAVKERQDVAVEILNYRRDGTPFWNALYLSPVYDKSGKLIYFFASQIDVTRRKQAEAVLQQSQRMEALGGMASGVAHEFNNLMTVVIGSAHLVLARIGEDRIRTQLERIEWAARQAGRLTQQMLSFARRQFHDPQPADLNAIVSDTDSLLAQIVGENIALTFDLAPAPVPVVVDAGQLEMALINLARNAADAMPDGGTVTISTRTHAASDAHREEVSLSLADSGIGMSPDILRMAREPFFTTKDRGKGSGLGLSMVAGFVEQSGGHLEIDSTPGEGTRVTLMLPRRAA
jgi:PAS domain S-box-containing protein